MNWLSRKAQYLRIYGLSSRQVELLSEAGIPSNRPDDGTFIEAERLEEALTLLGARVLARYPSEYKRVDEVVLHFSRTVDGALATDGPRAHMGLSGKLSPAFDLILTMLEEDLAPLVGRDVILHPGCGEVQEPPADDCFHVFVDSSPAPSEPVAIPLRLYGVDVEVSRRQAAFTASGQGVTIWDEDGKFAVGELVGNCLYLHFDLFGRKPRRRSLVLFARLLEVVAEELTADDVLAEVLERLGVPPAVRTSDGGAACEGATPAGSANTAGGGEDGAPCRASYTDSAPKRFGKQTAALVEAMLLPVVGQNILLHLSGGDQAPIFDGDFHVFFNATSSQTKGADVPQRVFGEEVPAGLEQRAWKPGHGCLPIRDASGASQFAAASVVGSHCLYIHFPVLRGTLTQRLLLLGRILQASLAELDIDGFVAREAGSQIRRNLGPLKGRLLTPRQLNKFGVAVSGFDERCRLIIHGLVQRLILPAVGKDIQVSNCFGENFELVEDGTHFAIYFQSSPLGDAIAPLPEEIFGQRHHKEGKAHWPSGGGISISDERGFLAAELVGESLFIHFQVFDLGTQEEVKILAALLARAALEIAHANGGITGGEGGRELLSSGYVDGCLLAAGRASRSGSGQPRQFENGDRAALEELAGGGKLAAAIERMRTAESDLIRFEATDHFGPEYDQLLEIEKVVDVTVRDGWILVDTVVLNCLDPRTGILHEIGAFQIQIPTEGGRLRWINQTRTAYGEGQQMYAPHVQTTGYACEGSTKDEWPRYIAARQFANVVMMGIAFIESVNVNDLWGKHIDNWPIAHTA